MDKLELIKTAHVIDQGLETLSAAVTTEHLKRRIGALHAEWQELAYVVTAHLCGIDGNALGRGSKRKTARKKIVDSEETTQEPNRSATVAEEKIHAGTENVPSSVMNENVADKYKGKEE